jgi:hypothetical protein
MEQGVFALLKHLHFEWSLALTSFARFVHPVTQDARYVCDISLHSDNGVDGY